MEDAAIVKPTGAQGKEVLFIKPDVLARTSIRKIVFIGFYSGHWHSQKYTGYVWISQDCQKLCQIIVLYKRTYNVNNSRLSQWSPFLLPMQSPHLTTFWAAFTEQLNFKVSQVCVKSNSLKNMKTAYYKFGKKKNHHSFIHWQCWLPDVSYSYLAN